MAYLQRRGICPEIIRRAMELGILYESRYYNPLSEHHNAAVCAFAGKDEIVVLYDGEQHLRRLLQPDEELKYIVVLPHISMARELRLPKVPCLFATVDYAGKEEPDVIFYKDGERHERQ